MWDFEPLVHGEADFLIIDHDNWPAQKLHRQSIKTDHTSFTEAVSIFNVPRHERSALPMWCPWAFPTTIGRDASRAYWSMCDFPCALVSFLHSIVPLIFRGIESAVTAALCIYMWVWLAHDPNGSHAWRSCKRLDLGWFKPRAVFPFWFSFLLLWFKHPLHADSRKSYISHSCKWNSFCNCIFVTENLAIFM